jgi:hypothetical protein
MELLCLSTKLAMDTKYLTLTMDLLTSNMANMYLEIDWQPDEAA